MILCRELDVFDGRGNVAALNRARGTIHIFAVADAAHCLLLPTISEISLRSSPKP